jgi:hypothetical protein
MKLERNIKLLLAISAPLVCIAYADANAGETINEAGTMACVADKWNETEKEKGHKLVESSVRCVLIPDNPAAPKVTEVCPGNYEYLPDKSWKSTGTCTDTYPGGDTVTVTWEEGSHLKEYTYKNTGGTGKFKGATGGGTYMYENLTDTLSGGRFKGTIVLP